MQYVYLVRRIDNYGEQPYVVGCFLSVESVERALFAQGVSLADFKRYDDHNNELYYAELVRLSTTGEPDVDILRYALDQLDDITS